MQEKNNRDLGEDLMEKKYQLLLKLQQSFQRANLDLLVEYVKVLKFYCPPTLYPRLLDLGCGEGPDEVTYLEKQGYKVTGITIQSWMCSKPNILLMDFNNLSFPPSSFHVIFSSNVLEHSYCIWLSLLEAYTVLMENGIFFLIVPPHGTLTKGHPSLLPLKAWKELFPLIGFEVLVGEETIAQSTDKAAQIYLFVLKKSIPGDNTMKELVQDFKKLHEG